MTEKTLIIEIKNSGLGDQLFHSHLPEIAKTIYRYDKVYISNKSEIKFDAYKEFVWDINPYIDGYTNKPGTGFDITDIINEVCTERNLLDVIMVKFGLDNGLTQNQPKIYYQPKIITAFTKLSVYDPNYLSWIGDTTPEDFMHYIQKNNIRFDAIMKLRKGKIFFVPGNKTKYIETPTLMDFCDLIYSVKKFYCLTSGAATIASGINVPAFVFYGKKQPIGYQHYGKHKYILVKKKMKTRVKRKLKKYIQVLTKKTLNSQ